jgi:hypothetical protein
MVAEIGIVGIGGIIAWRYPVFSERVGKSFLMVLERLARNPWGAAFTVAALPVIARLAILPLLGVPVPGIHDEFSHLLVADTFAHGRLANPTHPFWPHFETFFVLHHPVYVSQYPPGTGAVMALGQVVFGHPWVGVVMSVAAMCAATYWAAAAWLPGGWAVLAGLIAGLRLGVFGYWMNSYWGGALAAAAGAVALGGFGRLLKAPSARSAVAFGAGSGGLLLIRPYEGALFTVLLAVALIWRSRPVVIARPVAICALIPILAGVAAQLGYTYRITGNPFRLAQLVNLERYGYGQVLPWLRPTTTPLHRHTTMRQYMEDFEIRNRRNFENWTGNLRLQIQKAYVIFRSFCGPLLAPAFLALPLVWITPARMLLLITALYISLFLLHMYFTPHYMAAMTAGIYILMFSALFRLCTCKPRIGSAVFGLLLIGLSVSIIYTAATLHFASGRALNTFENRVLPGNFARARVIQSLPKTAKHLLLVRYGQRHDFFEEWVHNGADLQNAPVLWARSIGTAEDARLMEYYPDRQVWLVQPGAKPLLSLLRGPLKH